MVVSEYPNQFCIGTADIGHNLSSSGTETLKFRHPA
jgi:hypothetical protein